MRGADGGPEQSAKAELAWSLATAVGVTVCGLVLQSRLGPMRVEVVAPDPAAAIRAANNLTTTVAQRGMGSIVDPQPVQHIPLPAFDREPGF